MVYHGLSLANHDREKLAEMGDVERKQEARPRTGGLSDAVSLADWARHVETPTGVAAVLDALSTGGVVWVRGGPGRGKTHLLRSVAAVLRAGRAGGFAAPEGRWLVVPVDLGGGEAGCLAQVSAAFARLASERFPGVKLTSTPTFEWIAWLESGPGALEREALERHFQSRVGQGVSEARRLRGPELVANLLREYAELRALPAPSSLGPAEKLHTLRDQLEGVEDLKVALILDNLDAAEPGEAARLCEAVARDLPALYGQQWSLVAASAEPPNGAVAARATRIDLPGLDREVVAGLAGRCEDAAELATADFWDLLGDLLVGEPRPLPLAGEALREALAAGVRPVTSELLLASAALTEWLSAQLPLNWAAHAADDPERSPAVARLERLLFWRAAAGREPVAPLEALDDLSRAERQELEVCPQYELRGAVRLRLAHPDELACWRAAGERLAGMPRREVLGGRGERLRQVADAMSRAVVWENVNYPGEVLCGDTFNPLWTEPLPPSAGFRVVVLTRPGALSPQALTDPRTVVLMPGPPTEAELPGLRRAAAARAVAEEHDQPTVRAAARTWLTARYEEGLLSAAEALAAGRGLARPALVSTWAGSVRRQPIASWPAILLRPRLAAAHRRRGQWLDHDRLEAPLGEAALEPVWRDLAAGVRAPVSPLRQALRLAPEQEPPGYQELLSWLKAHGGALSGPELLRRLTAPPHGLTVALAKLYLLALILRGEPPLTIEASGLGDERLLGPSALAALEWGDLQPHQLRRLARADVRSWAELLPFIQALVPDLGSALNPVAIKTGRERLSSALARLGEQLDHTGNALHQLGERLSDGLPERVPPALARLRKIARSSSPEQFDRLLADLYGADPAAWDEALADFHRWQAVAAAADELVRRHDYLAEVTLPPQHPLEGDLLALRGQLRLQRLLASPSLIRGLLAQGEHFRRQYATAYAQAHRRHHDELTRLRAEWDRARRQAAALERLNRLDRLGEPDAASAIAALSSLESLLRPCEQQPEVAHSPVCGGCGWRFGDPTPLASLASVQTELDRAFERRTGRLRAVLTDEIVQQAGHDDLLALHQVLALQQGASLPEVLTAETVELLARCLPAAAPRVELLGPLRERFPAIGPDDLPAVVAAFEELLRAALEQAGHDPDGRVSLG